MVERRILTYENHAVTPCQRLGHAPRQNAQSHFNMHAAFSRAEALNDPYRARAATIDRIRLPQAPCRTSQASLAIRSRNLNRIRNLIRNRKHVQAKPNRWLHPLATACAKAVGKRIEYRNYRFWHLLCQNFSVVMDFLLRKSSYFSMTI